MLATCHVIQRGAIIDAADILLAECCGVLDRPLDHK